MSESNRTIGNRGELIAIEYLQRHDYRIVETNYVATKGGEIDIIAEKDGITVFFEVKYRTGISHGSAIECFTYEKRRRFLFAVRWYCMKKKITEDRIQIDFIAIQKGHTGHRVTHMKNVAMG